MPLGPQVGANVIVRIHELVNVILVLGIPSRLHSSSSELRCRVVKSFYSIAFIIFTIAVPIAVPTFMYVRASPE